MFRPLKSTIVIGIFFLLNGWVWWKSFIHTEHADWGKDSSAILKEVPSTMKELHYFHLEKGDPSLSLAADVMHSLGEEQISFESPRGTYTKSGERELTSYSAIEAQYLKARHSIRLKGDVLLEQGSSQYRAQEVVYYPKKDLLYGKERVEIDHLSPKDGQKISLRSERMKAKPRKRWSELTGQVNGEVISRLKSQAPLYLNAQELEFKGVENQILLKESVKLKRGEMQVTARNGEVFLGQVNKKLKYFVLNDDVKVTENLMDAQGRPLQRQAFAERMEGFGQEKIVLSGAPRVLQGKDVIKGYRITLREKMEFIEVEDAMSDVQVKKDQDKNAKER